MEINKEAERNPIIQDTKKGKPRFYAWPSLANYGALPQTYEHPGLPDEHTRLEGDGDPVDVLEIGSQPAVTGAVYPVRILGALAMLDDAAVDWKIITLRLDDPEAGPWLNGACPCARVVCVRLRGAASRVGRTELL
jgi:inorganic pyrophosphatase